MANQNRPLDDRLRELKTYASKIKKASKWFNSDESISHASTGKTSEKTREYIYEFYCYIRILVDLKQNYDIEFIPGKVYVNHFPKAPGSKSNFPYFSIKDKKTGNEVTQLCAGIDIIGQDGETSAPDISFLIGNTGDKPTHADIEMFSDAKFRHKPDEKVSKGEFSDVFAMVFNLNCMNPPTTKLSFNEFTNSLCLNGNNILTNGTAYNDNHAHHQRHKLTEFEKFDVNTIPRKIG